jgi:L-fuconolactonase
MPIDSHNHFWCYSPVRHAWINEPMAILKQDYLPADLKVLLKENDLDGCIAVQAEESYDENAFLLDLASSNRFIKGIVGWMDMLAPNAHQKLSEYSQQNIMKGFRYVLQDKADRALMLDPKFIENLRLFQSYGYIYDLLILPDQLGIANQLVKSLPRQKFVLDHLAKPEIKQTHIMAWKKDIEALAKNENVFCKLSGMVTEADRQNHDYHHFVPYLNVALHAFGSKRLMFGSDWPVCLLASSYKQVAEIVSQYISTLSKAEQADIMGNNAIVIYNL